MKTKIMRCLASLLCLCVPSLAWSQNIVSNGGFEFPANPTNSIVGLNVGNTTLSGWTISGTGSLFLVTVPLTSWTFQAAEGRQFISFNGNNVRLSQVLNTAIGQTYEVSFTVGYFQGSPAMRVIADAVSTNGTSLGSLDVPAPSSAGWNPPSRFRFVADTTETVLRFRGTNATPNVDLVMDAVSVEPIVRPISIRVSQVQLCWLSETNRSYQLQRRTNLVSEAWTDVGDPIPSAGPTTCVEQPATEPQGYFRVVTLP